MGVGFSAACLTAMTLVTGGSLPSLSQQDVERTRSRPRRHQQQTISIHHHHPTRTLPSMHSPLDQAPRAPPPSLKARPEGKAGSRLTLHDIQWTTTQSSPPTVDTLHHPCHLGTSDSPRPASDRDAVQQTRSWQANTHPTQTGWRTGWMDGWLQMGWARPQTRGRGGLELVPAANTGTVCGICSAPATCAWDAPSSSSTSVSARRGVGVQSGAATAASSDPFDHICHLHTAFCTWGPPPALVSPEHCSQGTADGS